VLEYGFGTLGLDEILAVAAAGNVRSHAVMKRLGMAYDREFDDPNEPPHLRRSVLYRLPDPGRRG
jgi:RimJ/RimL family protein N-acetyltransferase